ncbi:biotin transporter BioY [Rhizobium sp. RU36D]|uniref:biotin transporter BioY n=1 Tax=Rhizobium sp. RU36D TaxID=1907415 RepID=UPI0009D8399D|nr:biotin transporter BioY [Rhizobium sp. RU36D]SMC90858.1 biotin transport system substrate-specific component [Rhizobium sp. RU36D]
MTSILVPAKSGFDPLGISGRPLLTQAVLLVVGTAVLALASQISVPMVPVPVTLQTLAITMIGVLYGWRLGTLTVLAWLGEAMLGLPVLAGGNGGLAPFVGPTAGYLAAFPIIAAMAGLLAQRGWTGDRVVLSFSSHLLANLTCLAIGGAWLAVLLGVEKGLALGVVPFLVGAVVKSALAAALLMAVARHVRPSRG